MNCYRLPAYIVLEIPPPVRASAEDIFKLSFPKQDFVIDTLSIYEFDPQAMTCHLSFQSKI